MYIDIDIRIPIPHIF